MKKSLRKVSRDRRKTFLQAISGVTMIDGFTSDATTVSGVDATGRAWEAEQTGMQLTAITPATTTASGRLSATQYLVGGMQKNPTRTSASLSTQGYDARASEEGGDANYDAALTVSLPVATAAGDTFVHGIPNTVARDGGDPFNQDYKTLHITSQALPSNAVLKSSVGPYKVGEPEYYVVDMPSLLGRCLNLDSTGVSIPPVSVLMQSLGLKAPAFSQNSATIRVTGYETLMPVGIKGRAISGNNVQYGADIAEVFGHAAIGLHYDAWTSSEKEQVLWALIRHGVEWGFPLIASGIGIKADGGHQQFWQFAAIVALIATGREAEIATFMVDTGGGNWDGFLLWDDTSLTDFTAHTNSAKPAMSRQRTLGVQIGGSTLRIPSGNGDDDQVIIPAGSGVYRDGRIVARTSSNLALVETGTADVNVVIPPVPAFSQNDVIHFTPPIGSLQRGRHDWGQRGGFGPSGSLTGKEYLSPSEGNQYRSLQANFGALASIRAFGVMHPTLHNAWGYLRDTSGKAGQGYPFPTNDYTTNVEFFNGLDGNQYTLWPGGFQNIVRQFDNMPQSNVATGVAAIVIDGYGNTGSTSTNILDGEISAIYNGYDFAPTSIRGTATPNSEVQIRIVDAADNSVVVEDWFNAPPTKADGRFEAVCDLTKSSKWHHIQYRYVGDTVHNTFTTKTGVGYKFMGIGQSQMSIMFKSNGLDHEILPANLDQASYYSWQSYNAGATAESETMSILDTTVSGSDGVAAMVNQICQHITDNTKFQIVRQSVNGQSMQDFLTQPLRFGELTEKLERGDAFNAIHENWDTSHATRPTGGGTDIDQLMGINMHGLTGVLGTFLDTIRPDFKPVFGLATRNANTGKDAQYSHEGALRAQELGFDIGYVFTHYQIEDAGGPHALTTGEGNINLGGLIGLSLTKALGLHSVNNPHFNLTGGGRSSDGKTIWTEITLNGGTLRQNDDIRMVRVEQDYSTTGTELSPTLYQCGSIDEATAGPILYVRKLDDSLWPTAASGDNYIKILENGRLNTGSPLDIPLEQEIAEGLVLVDMPGVLRPMVAAGRIGDSGEFRLVAATNVFTQEAFNPILPILPGSSSVDAILHGYSSRKMTSSNVSPEGGRHYISQTQTNGANSHPDMTVSPVEPFGADSAAGDEYIIVGVQFPILTDVQPWDGTGFAARTAADVSLAGADTQLTPRRTRTEGSNKIHEIIAHTFIQEGSGSSLGVNWLGNSDSNQITSFQAAFEVIGGNVLASTTHTGTDSVALTGLPSDTNLIVVSKTASGDVSWSSGITVDHTFYEDGNNTGRGCSIGHITASGDITITATGAEDLLVVQVPAA